MSEVKVKTKISPNEYQVLKEFFQFFFNKYFPKASLEPDQHPIAILEKIEKSSPIRACKGLEMALRDCVEMTSGWNADQIIVADAELEANGLISLTALRDRYSRKRNN